jgi:hypothetical protein
MEYDASKYRPVEPGYWDRDPVFSADDPDLIRWGVRVLDPSAVDVPGLRPRSTLYFSRHLLVADSAGDALAAVAELAKRYQWTIRLDERARHTTVLDGRPVGVQRYVLEQGDSAAPPDAWLLLQQARLRAGKVEALAGVSLEHVLDAHPRHWESNPRHWESNPQHWESNPAGSYGDRGEGGRQPIAYTGPDLPRTPDHAYCDGRSRVVVGVLDTGCGRHPWLDGIVDQSVTLNGAPIGLGTPPPPPDTPLGSDFAGPLDGVIDELAGHGTFICGLIRQHSPDASVLAWRGVPSEGYIPEWDFLDALLGIAELSRLYAADPKTGHRLDVLNLSMGFYPETPDDVSTLDPTLGQALQVLSRAGTVVVCSAGNDATARMLLPAAYPEFGVLDGAPLVAVGARNPNGTVALFSNTGTWVTTYAPGASVFSTMPPLSGGIQPSAKTRAFGLDREGIDPDDFTRSDPDAEDGSRLGGFALWSGTSFAAPIVAGRIAAQIAALQGDAADDPGAAAGRGADAVAAVLAAGG